MFSRQYFGCLTIGLAVFFGSDCSHCAVGDDEYEIRMIDNSETFSQAIAINSKQEVLGTREVTEAGALVMKSYFRSGETDVQIDPPKDFTNIDALALSDTGIVVGYVSRPTGNPKGSLRGFAWDSKTNELTMLDPLPTDIAGHAQDISADGKRITGYSTGHTPPRMRPCVWQWHEDSKKYVPQALSTIIQNNPFLQSSQVLISPNGKRIAACIAESQISDFMFDNSLCIWEYSENGEWNRKRLSTEQIKLKDINDEGIIVGCTSGQGEVRACVIDNDGKIDIIDLLPDDESNVAYGINNAGVVVGMSDDPPGAEGGPQAFIWRKGVVEPLKLLKGAQDSAAMTINQDGVIAGFMLKDTNDEEAAVVSFIRRAK